MSIFSKSKINFDNFLNIIAVALSATLGYIFIFNHILRFLDTHFPAIPSNVFLPLFIPQIRPEPFEISLYLSLAITTAIIIILINVIFIKIKKQCHCEERVKRVTWQSILLRLLYIIVMTSIFVIYLGKYPMAHDPYPDFYVANPTLIYFGLTIYLLVIVFLIIELNIINKLCKKTSFPYLVSIIVIAIIALVTFDPTFPLVWHDYSFFIGPIQEIAKGKTIFTDVSSQYGFFSILIFAFLNKIHLFDVAFLPAVIWLLYIFEYFFCYYLIYKTSKSITLGLFCLASIFTINYFSLLDMPNFYPQIGPMRWLPFILLALLYYKTQKIDAKIFIFATALLSFWVIDIGLEIIIAYGLTTFLFLLNKKINLKGFIKANLFFILYLIVIFITTNFIHILVGYKTINIFEVFLKVKQYSGSGLAMISLPGRTYLWLIIFAYLTSIIVFVKNKQFPHLANLILLVANFSLLSSIYYVGRSHPHNLFNASVMPLINIFLLLELLFQYLRSNKLRITLLITIFLIFITYPAYNRAYAGVRIISQKIALYQQPNYFAPFMKTTTTNMYKRDAELIKNNLKEKEILLIASDDTYLLYMTDKTSMLDYDPIVGIVTYDDLNFALKKVIQKCPKKIAIDCDIFPTRCHPFQKLNFGIWDFHLILDRIKTNCHIEYKPIKCAKHICIAEGITKL